MSVSLNLICNIKTPINSFEKTAKKLLEKLNKIRWNNGDTNYSYDEKGNIASTKRKPEDDKWKIVPQYEYEEDLGYVEYQYIELDSDNWYISNIELYENICVMTVLSEYQQLYTLNKNPELLQDFRKTLFEVVNFLNGTEVIFLPSDRYKISKYYDLALENKTYNSIKKLMLKEVPTQITNFYDLTFLNQYKGRGKNEFICDDFYDLKYNKPYPTKEISLVLCYTDKPLNKYNSSFEKIPDQHKFHHSFISKYKIDDYSKIVDSLKTKDQIFINQFNTFRNKVKSENKNIIFALYILEEKFANCDMEYLVKDNKEIAPIRYNSVTLKLSVFFTGKTNIYTNKEIKIIYDDFKDLI